MDINIPVQGLREIADRYDGFLIDQWGVLHDGEKPYPGAVEALARIKAEGHRIVIISNSGKRAAVNADRLARLGFPPESYDDLVTSGEVAWQALAERTDPIYSRFGNRCLLITTGGDAGFLDDLELESVETPEKADFVLLASIDSTTKEGEVEAVLHKALMAGLPLICTNPDRIRITPEGTAPGTGALAERYQKRGGTVSFIGKPFPKVYEHCRRLMNDHEGDRQLLCIGDSLQHDIRGGRRAGYHTAFVLGGIFAEHFAGLSGDEYKRTLQRLMEEHEAYPDWVLEQFAW